jgi:hypothetical protein
MESLVKVIARTLAVLWAAFWLFVFTVESLVWRTPLRLMLVWVALGLLFGLLAAVARRWESVGGALLLLMGMVVGAGYAMSYPAQLAVWSVILTTTVLSVPPLVAGALFLLHHRASVIHIR